MKKPNSIENIRNRDLFTIDKAKELVNENISISKAMSVFLNRAIQENQKETEISFQKDNLRVIMNELENVQKNIDDVVDVLKRSNKLDTDMWKAVLCMFNGNEIYWRTILNALNNSEIEKER